MDILTRGIRRFEVVRLNEEKEYLRGEVEFFDDDDPGPAPAEMQHKALMQYRGLLESAKSRPRPIRCSPTRSSAFNWRRRCRISIF